MKETVKAEAGADKVRAEVRTNTGRRPFEGGLDTVSHNPARRVAGRPTRRLTTWP